MSTTIPGNEFAERATKVANEVAESGASTRDGAATAGALVASTLATLALAHEQHQRNRLAAITAMHRGLDLPRDLAKLAREGRA